MKKIIVLIACLAMSSVSFAALYARDLDGDFSNGHEGVYDDVLDITWLANVLTSRNFRFTVEGIDPFGQMTWGTANNWIGEMNRTKYFGYEGWRLPAAKPVNESSYNRTFSLDGSTDIGYQITAKGFASEGSAATEMAFMFYNNFEGLGACNSEVDSPSGCRTDGKGYLSSALDPNNYMDLFTGLIPLSVYYSSGELNEQSVLGFNFHFGSQSASFKQFQAHQAWAVHDGDIGSAIVPIPATIWFFISGLAGLLGFRHAIK